MLRRLAAATGLITVFALPGCGFLGGSSATLIMPTTAAVGSDVQVEGAYSKSTPGLEVSLRAKGSNRTLATSSTDRQGRFKFTFEPAEAGKTSYAVAIRDGSDSIVSPYRVLSVLEQSTVSLTRVGAEEAELGDKRKVRGKVEPITQPRSVHLESSLDGKSWTKTTSKTTTGPKGTFEFPLDTSSVGTKHYRVLVTETATHSEAVGGDELVSVFDYKALGKRYVDCVTPLNEKLDEFEKLQGLAAIKQSARKMIRRNNKQASCLRNADWPPSIAEDIETIASNANQDADVWNRIAKASTIAEYTELSYEFTVDTASPTRVRAILHLPRRPV